MKMMTFGRPAMYLRNDADAGWALWKWRLLFTVTTRPTNEEGGSLVLQLRGRAKFLRTRGEVKSAELMERAARELVLANGHAHLHEPAQGQTK